MPDVVDDLCRERVIVTEFVEGRRFAEILDDTDEERSRWGEILFRFYVNGPFRHRLLNGDPHPGNSLFLRRRPRRVPRLRLLQAPDATSRSTSSSRSCSAVYAQDADALLRDLASARA